MAPLETNEVVQLVLTVIVLVTTSFVRLHPGNTPRTRGWWGRFVVMVAFLLGAAVFTNVEQFWPGASLPGRALNLGEHFSMLLAAGWAMLVAYTGQREARQRSLEREGTEG